MSDEPGAEPTAAELADAEDDLAEARHHSVVVNLASEHWGKPGYLTDTEKGLLKEFQKAEPTVDDVQARAECGRKCAPCVCAYVLSPERCGHSLHTHTQALRFLRARKFDVAKALVLLKESREFAAKEKCDLMC